MASNKASHPLRGTETKEKMMIQQTGENTFFTIARGCEMTLTKDGEEWVMYTVNAMVRAYNNGFAIPKYFKSLKDVEAKYKTWRGIEALAA